MDRELTPAQVLALPMPGSELTVRDYLTALLIRLWTDGSDFSAKRPFGDSDWQWDLYQALGDAGFPCRFDDDGYRTIADIDTRAADALIAAAIRLMCEGPDR